VSENEKEPILRMPWQALLLGAMIAAAYAAQLGYGGGTPEAAAGLLGFSPRDLWQGGGSGLFTYVFLNGGWAPAGLAVLFTIVLAAPFARRMPGWMGFLGLLSFFLLCGAAGALAFAAASPGGSDVLIGSSASVSGLLAAAVLMVGGRAGRGLPANPLLLAIAGLWLIGNLAAAFTDFLGPSAFSEYGWQAHVGGFVAGALLARPWAKLFGSRRAGI
jgi:membrane associated rhomboid family serine protease